MLCKNIYVGVFCEKSIYVGVFSVKISTLAALAAMERHLCWRMRKNIYVGVFCEKTSTLACFVEKYLRYRVLWKNIYVNVFCEKHLRWRVLWKNIYVGVFCGKISTLAFFQTHWLGYKYDQYRNNKDIKNNQLLINMWILQKILELCLFNMFRLSTLFPVSSWTCYL